MGQGGGLRAVGGQDGDDLGGVRAVEGGGSGHQAEDGSDRELHFDGLGWVGEDGY